MLGRNLYIVEDEFFFVIDAFLSHGNIVGVIIFTWGIIWGTNICRVVTKIEITVLEVPKLQKTIP